MAVAAVVLWSCGSDEDVVGDDGYNAENGKVANTKWTARNADYGIGDDWVSTLDETYNFYFYSTTEGLFYYGRKDNDSDFGSSSERTVAHFSYNVNGNMIELEYITEPLFSGFDRLTLNGNTLSVSGFEFTKDALDASDNSWLSTLHGTTGDCKWYHNLKNAVWIAGEGRMADYASYDRTPWATHDHTPNMVFVEDGVTRIGNQAFANPSIGEVELPSTLKEIGNYAFSGTTVSQVNLPNAIVKIGEGAFSDCSYLTNVYMPESVEEIGDYAFSDCKKASLSGTPALKRIGQGAFMGCTVTSWTDSEVLEEIGVAAFTDCGFSEVSLPNSLKTIGSLAFSDDGISTIRIGTGLTNVNGTPFWPKSSGSMYVNKNVPLELQDDIIDGDKVGGWTLYVPVGSKLAYSKAAYWKNFKRITESSELTGDGTVVDEEEVPNTESSTDEKEQDLIDANDHRRGSVSTEFKGNGTSSSPYLISSAADLRLLSDECRTGNTFKGKYFKMTTDITINENVLNAYGKPNDDSNFERWIPIGRTGSYKDYAFYGTFDGDGHTVSGIYINRICDGYSGLFGVVTGNIKNLTLKDSYICSPGSGGIVGRIFTDGRVCEIFNCHNYAMINGKTVGGIVGSSGEDVRITQCSNHGDIHGSESLSGGIAASAAGAYITDCVNIGNVTVFNGGGIIGSVNIGSTIRNCINKGNVTCERYAAGIGGRVLSSTITNCVNLGKVEGTERSSAIAYYARNCTINWNHYLEEMSTSDVELSESSTVRNNNACSSMEMRSSDVLSDLNSRSSIEWINDNDGYPILEWFLEYQ